MWVYQESSNQALIAPKNQNQSAAAQQVDPAAPIDAKERVSFGSSKPSEKSSTGGRSRTIPRDCIFLSISYLFGALLAGVTLALCRANELDTLSAYLSNWAGLFTLDDPKSVWNLFGAEYMTTAGGATVLLLLGLSAFGPVLIHLFAMLFGLGIGMVQLQLFLQAGWKSSLQALCLTGIPTAAVVTCLCLFGASALRVSGRLQKHRLWEKGLLLRFRCASVGRAIPGAECIVFAYLRHIYGPGLSGSSAEQPTGRLNLQALVCRGIIT